MNVFLSKKQADNLQDAFEHIEALLADDGNEFNVLSVGKGSDDQFVIITGTMDGDSGFVGLGETVHQCLLKIANKSNPERPPF